MTAADARFMATALSLGRRGQGQVWPNPAVGCVIVRDCRIVGRGWTQPGGRPHAETEALARAGAAARDATAYVTLEPCAHHGQTPPCAGALAAAGISRVVTALEDPDPRVQGGGHAALRAAGIEVTTGVLAGEAACDHEGFLRRVTEGRPFVTLKLAASLDGRIATASGESRWITGPEARRAVHAARARHDGVLVGGGTARADDPSLTVRDQGAARQPVRVIAARTLDLPQDGTLARTARELPLWLLHGPAAAPGLQTRWKALGACLLDVPQTPDGLDPRAMLETLATAGLTRLYCEGGGRLAASLLACDLVDELHLFTAGTALGADGMPAVGPMSLARLADAPRLALTETRPLGPDTLSVWRRP